MATRNSNQRNLPPPKKRCVDSKGNLRKKVFCKSGTATLLLASGLTDPAATVAINNLQESVAKLGGKVECNFLITR